MEPLVSVVIPTYKRPSETVLRAVNSALKQTYRPIEVLIIDDGPDDFAGREAVLNALAPMPENVLYYQHERNMGACAARNTGIALSCGEYIAFLDDDDEWRPEKIARQMHLFMKNPGLGLVYCRDDVMDDSTGAVMKNDRKCLRGEVFDDLIIDNFIGSTSFVLIPRPVFSSVGAFDTEMPAAQDAELWLRIAKEYPVDYVDQSLVIYHIHGGERISTNPEKKLKGFEHLLKKHENYLRAHPKADAARRIKMVPYLMRCGRPKQAWAYFFFAVRRYPPAVRMHLYYLKRMLKNRIANGRNEE